MSAKTLVAVRWRRLLQLVTSTSRTVHPSRDMRGSSSFIQQECVWSPQAGPSQGHGSTTSSRAFDFFLLWCEKDERGHAIGGGEARVTLEWLEKKRHLNRKDLGRRRRMCRLLFGDLWLQSHNNKTIILAMHALSGMQDKRLAAGWLICFMSNEIRMKKKKKKKDHEAWGHGQTPFSEVCTTESHDHIVYLTTDLFPSSLLSPPLFLFLHFHRHSLLPFSVQRVISDI